MTDPTRLASAARLEEYIARMRGAGEFWRAHALGTAMGLLSAQIDTPSVGQTDDARAFLAAVAEYGRVIGRGLRVER